jgi:hypothetical protein
MAATYKTLLITAACSAILNPPVAGGMLRRGKLYDILIGTNGTPADNFLEFDVARTTVQGASAVILGTLSSISSALGLDTADTGCAAFTMNNSSVETTITTGAEVWYVGINQRASYRWVAAPGSELVWPATSSAGFAVRARSAAYTGTATATLLFQEQ